jgi:drug/metabolite transporter (DMT)-like permease
MLPPLLCSALVSAPTNSSGADRRAFGWLVAQRGTRGERAATHRTRTTQPTPPRLLLCMPPPPLLQLEHAPGGGSTATPFTRLRSDEPPRERDEPAHASHAKGSDIRYAPVLNHESVLVDSDVPLDGSYEAPLLADAPAQDVRLRIDAASPSPPPSSSSSSSSSSFHSLADRTALVRSVMVQRADAVLEMTALEERMRTEADQTVAPVGFHAATTSPNASSPSAAAAPAQQLRLGNVLSTYIPPRLLGVAYLALSAIIFSVMALFVSLLSKFMPSFEIVWFRCVAQFLLGWLACQTQGVNFLGPVEKRRWLFVRGAVGCIGFSLFYFAIQHLTLADATTIFFTAPLYTGLFGYLFLRESVSKFDGLCTVASVFGVVMVVRPAFLFGTTQTDVGSTSADGGTVAPDDPTVNSSSSHTLGVIAAILGSLVSACVYIAIRKVGPGVHPLVFVCWMGLVGVFLTPFGALVQTFVFPSAFLPWFYVIMVGLCSFVGQILFNAGVQKEKAGPASMIRNLDVVFSFLWQITIEGILPNAWSVLGAIVISGSVVAMGVRKWRLQEQQPPAAAAAAATGAAAAPPSASSGAASPILSPSSGRLRSESAAGLALHELSVHEDDVGAERFGVDDADEQRSPKVIWH